MVVSLERHWSGTAFEWPHKRYVRSINFFFRFTFVLYWCWIFSARKISNKLSRNAIRKVQKFERLQLQRLSKTDLRIRKKTTYENTHIRNATRAINPSNYLVEKAGSVDITPFIDKLELRCINNFTEYEHGSFMNVSGYRGHSIVRKSKCQLCRDLIIRSEVSF